MKEVGTFYRRMEETYENFKNYCSQKKIIDREQSEKRRFWRVIKILKILKWKSENWREVKLFRK